MTTLGSLTIKVQVEEQTSYCFKPENTLQRPNKPDQPVCSRVHFNKADSAETDYRFEI